MQNLYESAKLLAEYLLFHYGAEDAIFERVPAPRDGRDFPVRCVHDLDRRFLARASAPGRSTWAVPSDVQALS